MLVTRLALPEEALIPNLFIVGAMKAGTTSLAAALSTHPDIFAGPIKEPNHFARELIDGRVWELFPATRKLDISQYLAADQLRSLHYAYIDRRDDYASLYRDSAGQRYVLDASTSYLSSPLAAALIAEASPNGKIIILTRPKADRAWSEFRMNTGIGLTGGDYQAALEREARALEAGIPPLAERYVSTGWYRTHRSRFETAFGSENVFVGDFIEMTTRPTTFMDRLSGFLDLDCTGLQLPHENAKQLSRLAGLNSWLYRSGIKSFGSRYLPGALVRLSKRILFEERAPAAMPEDFERQFWANYERLSPAEDLEGADAS